MYSGSFVKKNLQDDSYPYPVMNGGINPTGWYKEYNSEQDTIAISSRGANCGAVNYMRTKYWAGNSCFVLNVDTRFIYSKFLYYILVSIIPKEMHKKDK